MGLGSTKKPVRTRAAAEKQPGAKAGKTAAAAPRTATASKVRTGVATAQLQRGERRKRETRERLLRAAYALIAERGVDSVAINQITEAADVGFGSFYNHFDSKDAIQHAVIDEVLLRFGEALSVIADKLQDPAEVLAASVRYVILRSEREPSWGRLLARTAFALGTPEQGMGRFMIRDLQRGLAAGRFRTQDPFMTLIAAGGTVIAAISVQIEQAADPKKTREFAQRLGFDTSDLSRRTASSVLKLVGVPDAEAEEIARRPLPEMDLPAGIL